MFGGFYFGQPLFGDGPANPVLSVPVVPPSITYAGNVLVDVASMAVGLMVTSIPAGDVLVDAPYSSDMKVD